MKKLTLILILLGLAGLSVAQNHSGNNFQIVVGDTVLWTPFENCDNIKYSFTNRGVVSFSYLEFGKTVRLVGNKPGYCTIFASCGDSTANAGVLVSMPKAAQQLIAEENKPSKPDVQVFADTFSFNPPNDHFFISYYDPYNDCNTTFCKIGPEEAYNNGRDIDRFWNTKTGKHYYYRPESQGWTPDVDGDFQAFGDSFFPLNSFAREKPDDDLSQYYVGDEEVLGVNCWHFFVDQTNGSAIQYWVDPSNGCTLRRQVNVDKVCEVVVYNLNFRKWMFGPMFKKSMYDKTR